MAGIEQHLANLDKRVRRLEQIVAGKTELRQRTPRRERRRLANQSAPPRRCRRVCGWLDLLRLHRPAVAVSAVLWP
jgi:hypothetical protein